jgi:hypothetical protein
MRSSVGYGRRRARERSPGSRSSDHLSLERELLLDRRFGLAEGIAERIRCDLLACVVLDDEAPQAEGVIVPTHRIDERRVTARVVVERHEARRHGYGVDLETFLEGACEPSRSPSSLIHRRLRRRTPLTGSAATLAASTTTFTVTNVG